MKNEPQNLDHKEIGRRIRTEREAGHMTRDQLAALIGITSKFLSDIEYGEKGMSIQTLNKMAKVLNVSTDYILSGDPVVDSEENPEIKRLKQNILAPLSVCTASELRCMEQITRYFVKGLGKTDDGGSLDEKQCHGDAPSGV